MQVWGFCPKYDSYNDNLKQGILTNNGRHDDVMTLKWDCPDWCYVSRSKKEYEDCSIYVYCENSAN